MVDLSLTDIEVEWRASGSGICVIVEGETEKDDPWYYKRWFSDLARDITFFHQDGWLQVVSAVKELRCMLGEKKVYGILDRDFETPVYHAFPADGLVRTQKYTLENYLLDPDVWFDVVAPFTLRYPRVGWQTRASVRDTILSLYQQCIPLAAYNWIHYTIRSINDAAYQALPDGLNTWAGHPGTLDSWDDIDARLASVQEYMDLEDDLCARYHERRGYLSGLPLVELEKYVTGKPVLTLLRTSLQMTRRAWDDMLSAYMYRCSAPPTDLQNLVRWILNDAHA